MPAVSSDRRALRGCAPGSSSDTYENRPSSRAAAQPTTSLWSASGSTDANAGSAAFSLNWHFQRYAAAAASSAPAITGTVPCSARASAFASLSSAASGPHSTTSSQASAAAASISSRTGGAAPAITAASSAHTSAYPIAARGSKPPGSGITGTPSRRARSASGPPVVAASRGAPRETASS